MPKYSNQLLEAAAVIYEKLKGIGNWTDREVKYVQPKIKDEVKGRVKEVPGKNKPWIYDSQHMNILILGENSPDADPEWVFGKYPIKELLAAGAIKVSAKALRERYPGDVEEINGHLGTAREKLNIELRTPFDTEVDDFVAKFTKQFPKNPLK